MVNNKIVVLFGVLASGMALSPRKIPWVPKAVVKGFGAGVLTFSLWNVQPSNGVMLVDAMILNEDADQAIRNNNPTKVESPYPQLTPRGKKRLKEINAAEDKKKQDYENMLKDPVRLKDLLDVKTELNDVKNELKIEINGLKNELKTEIDDVNTKIDGVNSKLDKNTFGLAFFTLLSMIYFKREETDISREKVKLEQEALELKKIAAKTKEVEVAIKEADLKPKQDEADTEKQEEGEDKAK